MKRAIFFAVPPLVLTVLAIGLVMAEASRPADWQVTLNEYLGGRDARVPGSTTVQAVAWASRPWNFSPDMGHAVVVGRYFQGIDLPYPPEQVWCVLLKHDTITIDGPARGILYQVVFVSYHSDRLWRQDWVVHEGVGNPFIPAFVQGMERIGCDLGLKDMMPGDIQPVVMTGGG